MVEEVVTLMKFSIDPTLLVLFLYLLYHVLIIPSSSALGGIPLSPSTFPPSPRVVSFDWNDIVETQLPSSTPFQIRDILQYIVDKVTSASNLSSSTWKALGFLKILSVIYELLNFDRSPTREPWPPP
jgi:hypothetical protein